EQPALELLRPGHGERRRGCLATRAAQQVQQMARVVARPRAAAEDEVVARPLALGAQPPRRGPDERVEPVRGARDPAELVAQQVPPADVRQLVEEDDALPLLAPVLGVL